MEAINNRKPLIPLGWVRALVFTFIYMSVLLGLGVVLVLILKSNGKDITKIGSDPNFIYLAAIPTVIISGLFVWGFRKFIDRESIGSLGISIHKMGSHALVGFFMGILILCLGSLVLYFNGNLQWVDINFNARELFLSVILMILIAVSEEIVFRGYILNNLLHSLKKWPALLISALLFGLAHAANPDFSLVALVNIFLAGILLGVNYIYTKNLWFAILLHFSWNFFQGPILGYYVSGQKLPSLFQQEVHGSDLLSGGKFGFEGSIIGTGLYLIAILALDYTYRKKRVTVAS